MQPPRAAPTRAIGALDVCPVVWLDPATASRGAATAALAVAEQLGALGVPVFLYGELARAPERAERAYFRHGGLAELWRADGGRRARARLRPRPCRTRRAGATLVTARPPLAAFNVELDSGDLEAARAVAAGAARVRRRAAGVRAIGLALGPAAAPRSRPTSTTRSRCRSPRSSSGCERCAAAARRAGRGGELVGLVPEAALAGYPERRADPRLRPRLAHDRGAPGRGRLAGPGAPPRRAAAARGDLGRPCPDG